MALTGASTLQMALGAKSRFTCGADNYIVGGIVARLRLVGKATVRGGNVTTSWK
jgi:hypothetical protein